MKEILANTLCFTHGGKLAGLYGILATGKLSSNSALERAGDNVFKFTDPENKYKQEDGYLFFESIADRGRINYASLVDFQSGQTGFSFLLVASSQSLLNQVDMLGNTDGILMGRSDNQPLEIDLKEVDYKIIIPESYQKNIKEYCETLKELGIIPIENRLVFKSMQDIENLLAYQSEKNPNERQKEFCEDIGLNAVKSEKTFTQNEKTIETKTSKISTACDIPLNALPPEKVKKKNFLNGHDLVEHMKTRPTPGNLQRNSMLLFLEYTTAPLKESISKLSNKRPMVLDLIHKSEDLAFALNSIAKTHHEKEVNEHGEKRINRSAIRNIVERINNTNEENYIKNSLKKCLEIVVNKDISAQECASIIENYKNDNQWVVAINKVQQPYYMDNQSVKELIQNNMNHSEILLWKQGMPEWKHAVEIFPPVIESPTTEQVVKNIAELRQQNLNNKNEKYKIK